ncbi:hypothetical protein ACVILK_000670 [Bradyrhizobium embrapense]
MTVIAYIATAIFFTGIGFLVAAVWSQRAIDRLTEQRNRLIGGLWNAGAVFRAIGLDDAADKAFAAADVTKEPV